MGSVRQSPRRGSPTPEASGRWAAAIGRRRGLLATGLALVALALLAVLLAVGVAATTGAALVTFFVASVALGYAAALSRSGPTAQQRARLLAESGEHAKRVSTDGAPSDLRASTQQSLADVDEERRMHALEQHLADIRDSVGCERVTLWRAPEVGSTLRPVASAGSIAERRDPKQEALISWAADSRLTVSDGEPLPTIIAAPIGSGTIVAGVLSFEQRAGFARQIEELKRWGERHAAHLALLLELFEARTEFNRQRRHSQALLRAAHKIQSKSTLAELGSAICETALEVTSATRAALVGWDDDEQIGRVDAVSPAHHLHRGFIISGDSLVGQMCTNGVPLIKEDARHLERGFEVYGPGEQPGPLGSLGVMPLKHGDEPVLGAVVLEGDAPGEVMAAEMRHIGLLAAVAATSLRFATDYEATIHRAQTDQLTGLFNRRHFDEHLGRLLAESDRFGQSTSLVLCDIDHFKKINDGYGHDAGDAVLRHVAAIFLEQKRAVDICARYGGEEIAVLLPQTSWHGAQDLAERLRRMLMKRPARFAGTDIPVTASFGVASYPEIARSREALFPEADRALYQAKHEGRNCVRVAGTSADRSSA